MTPAVTGARCGPVVPVLDADDPVLPIRGGCVVHTHYAPCPLDGEPANPLPLHGDCVPSAEAALRSHMARTLGQRPLMLHLGSLGDPSPDGADHVCSTADAPCWCGAILYTVEALTSR